MISKPKTDLEQAGAQSTSDKSRRSVIQKIALGTGLASGAAALPGKWTKHVVNAVLIPAHATTSDALATTPEPNILTVESADPETSTCQEVFNPDGRWTTTLTVTTKVSFSGDPFPYDIELIAPSAPVAKISRANPANPDTATIETDLLFDTEFSDRGLCNDFREEGVATINIYKDDVLLVSKEVPISIL